MSKKDTDKARQKALVKIKRGLRGKRRVAEIAAETGYTAARIYQIKAEMVKAGELIA